MKDSIPKGTGNSRYLKSAISASATWEQFRDMLRDGTLPIDLGGINAAGWQVVGDALNKANLLPDSVASALGLTMSNPQIKDALNLLSGRGRLQTGTYIGTGTCGANNRNSITFAFVPKVVMVFGRTLETHVIKYGFGNWVDSAPTEFWTYTQAEVGSTNHTGVLSGKRLSWYVTNVQSSTNKGDAAQQLNTLNFKYRYYAIG